jgi:hypothetical protein
MRIQLCMLLLVPACRPDSSAIEPASVVDDPASATAEADLVALLDLPSLTFCRVADPANLASAYVTMQDADWVNYACAETCADWTTCQFGVVSPQGPVLSARGNLQIHGLAFVVDGIGGHFAFTPDGNDVVITHAGSGGTSVFNPFDRQLQAISNLKTVSLGWELGTTAIFSGRGGGWFTRKDAQPTSVRALTARPAAAIRWIKDNFAAGQRLGTVGSSMGTAATFGAHVWNELESVIDYQMLIGGPGFWDVNKGCGRVHSAAGHCDVDVAPCTGNPNSSFGNNDPACGPTTNNCRVPTVMAPTQTGSAYNDAINYVGVTTACTPTVNDARDASLDVSSLAVTVPSWSFHGRIDFVADEGGAQPPDADQGMGEGHMMAIYARIQSAKGWIDNEGTHHGDAWDKVPALMAAAASVVVAGMAP